MSKPFISFEVYVVVGNRSDPSTECSQPRQEDLLLDLEWSRVATLLSK